MSMNWSDLIQQAEEGGTYEALPGGDYLCEVESTDPKNATTGKPMIVAVFKVLTGPYAGRKVWNNFVISKENANALAWFFKHMKALGLDASFFALNPSLEATAAALIGKQATLSLGVKQWQGDNRNEVKKITPAVGGPAPMMGGLNANIPTAAPTPAPTQTGTAPQVPF